MSVHVQRVNLYDHVHSSRLVSLMGKLALLLTYMLVKTQGGAVCVSLYACVCVCVQPSLYNCSGLHLSEQTHSASTAPQHNPLAQ